MKINHGGSFVIPGEDQESRGAPCVGWIPDNRSAVSGMTKLPPWLIQKELPRD